MGIDIKPTGQPVQMPPNQEVKLKTDYHSMLLYKDLIACGDLVFDVGANAGDRSIMFLMLGAKVVGFEPQPVCVNFLRKLEVFPQFTHEAVALASEPGEAEMHICDEHCASTLSDFWVTEGRFAKNNWIGKEKVKVETLEKYIEKHGVPRFIKIDVEGFEYEVLKGLKTEVAYISIEFTSEVLEMNKQCMLHLAGLYDVEFQVVISENRFFSLTEWANYDNMIQFLDFIIKNDARAWGDIYIRSKRLTTD